MASVLDDDKQPTLPQNPAHYGQRILSAVFILVGLLAFFALRIWVNVYAFDLLIGMLMIISAYEVDNLLHKMGRPTYFVGFGLYPLLSFLTVLICLTLGLNLMWYVLINLGVIVVLGILMAFLPLICVKTVNKNRITDGFKYGVVKYSVTKSLNTCFACIWPVFLFSFAFAINHFNSFELAVNDTLLSYPSVSGVDVGILGLVLLFVTTMLADTFAMLTGRILKTAKINIQKLGPGKSWSGLAGGLIGGIVGAIIVYLVFQIPSNYSTLLQLVNVNLGHFVLFGLLCGVCNMTGDIFASYFKRRAVVKDFSNLIPGHGGVMDRINGLVVNSFCVFAILLFVFA